MRGCYLDGTRVCAPSSSLEECSLTQLAARQVAPGARYCGVAHVTRVHINAEETARRFPLALSAQYVFCRAVLTKLCEKLSISRFAVSRDNPSTRAVAPIM
jgi:hypothetical protein